MARTLFALLLALLLGLLAVAWSGCGDPRADEEAPRAAAPGADTGSEQAAPPSRPGWPELPTGRWRPHHGPAAESRLTPEQRELVDRLEAIGYAAGSREAPDAKGVVLHAREKAQPGLNLYSSGHAAEAVLMDMDGEILHRWRYDFDEAFPDHPLADKADAHFWRRVQLFENGDLLAIHEGLGILKLDAASKLVWAHPHPVHHDLDVKPNGEIWVLMREARLVPHVSRDEPILEDFIAVLAPDGTLRRRLSLLEAYQNAGTQHSWTEASRRFWEKEKTRKLAFPRGDIFHTNSLAVLDGRIADRVPAFRSGNVLLSMCHLDAIAVVDPERNRVVWSLEGPFQLQHDPQVLPDGNLMVFDNHWQPRRSRVVVIDPLSRGIVWEYRGSPESPFYSRTCGVAQRVPNGNTLITESDSGRAFEVTPAGEIVWEFYNPRRAGEKAQFIATLFELIRLAPDFPTDWAG
jgi:hypothetical protein